MDQSLKYLPYKNGDLSLDSRDSCHRQLGVEASACNSRVSGEETENLWDLLPSSLAESINPSEIDSERESVLKNTVENLE